MSDAEGNWGWRCSGVSRTIMAFVTSGDWMGEGGGATVEASIGARC